MAASAVDPALLERLRRRSLHLWGAGQTGIGVVHALARLGVRPVGFINKRKDSLARGVCGLPVRAPDEVLGAPGERPFVIDTTTAHADAIAARCRAAGLAPDEDFVSYDRLCPFDYQVIVSSVCNLRCISCPVGNRPERPRPGLMRASRYERVLDKILDETPLVGLIQLFNWGEPFLNPELARIVEITNRRRVLCALSSNLNLVRGFEDVIAARPAFLRVSMSGNRERYSVAHTGGEWDLFQKNLRELRELRERHHPQLVVEMAYHVYATTTAGDLAAARALCDELDFVFRPHLAALLPLDNVFDYLEGRPLGDEAREAVGMLRVPLDEALARARGEKDRQCAFERTLTIESDGSVKHCGLWIRPSDNRVSDDFLRTPIEEIAARRRENALCGLCKREGLHRFCSIYTDDPSDIAR